MINFDPRKFIKPEKKEKQGNTKPNNKQKNLVELREKVLKIIKLRGAVLPIEISKQIEMNTMFSGAILSELVSSGKIKISYGKIGGSPLYYVPERKATLSRLYKYLNEKDKKAYDLLKKEGILNDDDLTPLMSVAIRQIKDFAIPIDVTFKNKKGEEETLSLWKWYLLNEVEMNEKVSNIINKIKEKEEGVEKQATNTKKPIEQKAKQETKQEIGQQTGKNELEEHESNKKPMINKNSMERSGGTIKRDLEEEYKKEIKQINKEIEDELEKKFENKQVHDFQTEIEKTQTKDSQTKELKTNKIVETIKETKQKQPHKYKKLQLFNKTKEQQIQQTQKKLINKEHLKSQSEFLKRVINYFENNDIEIQEVDVIRKNTESNFLIKIPSIIGKIRYFCKAKSKKKINDKDISAVYIEAQSKKLPVLLLLTGECTKKAKELIEKDLKNITIKNI